ncbi:MAG: hypothetical protein KY455_10755 [Euryarchaeota archaeon]|nr:hypothetical protein [Euryarchaeota archaeon]
MSGSTYRVRSVGTRDEPTETEGEFLGFSAIGSGAEGIVMKLGDGHGDVAGKKRVIPLHMLLHVDVIKENKKAEEADKEEAAHYYS